jgi:hypothetical protein
MKEEKCIAFYVSGKMIETVGLLMILSGRVDHDNARKQCPIHI